jgi:hypothetical protein
MRRLLIVFIIMYGISVPANASLINFGGGIIYDDDRDLMWLQDANYARTSGYDADGMMTWSEANNWIVYINDIEYLGYSDWKLPHADSICGWNFNCIDSEMGYLYYTELENSVASGLINRGPFINMWENTCDPYVYWTDTTYPQDSNFAWIFLFNYGQQGIGGKYSVKYAVWPVRDAGDIPGPKEVTIDIKPGSDPNSINLVAGGTVQVAIFSTPIFDATNTDPLTVTLESAPVKLKKKGVPMASKEDINGDGLLDLVVHVSIEALQLTQSDTVAILEGQTFNGLQIIGSDSVSIVPP